MHVYFSGIGGTGISSLALIAQKAGYEVSGSDARPSQYLKYLADHGVTNTHIGVDQEFIASVHAKHPIDWFVYGSAQPMDFPDHPEFAFCQEMSIKQSKRDEFLSQLIIKNGLPNTLFLREYCSTISVSFIDILINCNNFVVCNSTKYPFHKESFVSHFKFNCIAILAFCVGFER